MPGLSFTAVVFDLDGVITQTAVVHSRAWKEMFDEYLQFREKHYGEPYREFTHDRDYLPYVDGKPRYVGVASFLKTRGIELPWGEPQDAPDKETICGLGNRKNQKFQEILKRDGVQLYESTITLVRELKNRGVHVGVASSSKNCRVILETAGILGLFETCVDGIVSEELQLQGKPEPDIFTTACDNLKADYDRSVVIEDAVSGVQAGVKGNFGLVIGVARENNDRELKASGADIVVKDLAEIDIDGIEKWFREGLPADQWSLYYYDYVPEQERTRESLCTIGNGYFGTRGAAEESQPDTVHYPGTYLAGIYNQLSSTIDGRTVVNEDLVNCPNWLPVQFRIDRDSWINLDRVKVLHFHRHLDLKRGVLRREVVIRDRKGRETLIQSRRVASMADPHHAALQYCITPLNYSAGLTVRAGIVYDVVNAGVERYKPLNGRHLKLISKGCDGNLIYVLTETNQSHIRIAEAANIVTYKDEKKIRFPTTSVEGTGAVFAQITTDLAQGQMFTVEKLVVLCTSKDLGVQDPLAAAKKAAATLTKYQEVEQASEKAWDVLWAEVDIQLNGDRLAQKLLRLHMYHLLIARSVHNAGINWGIPARGLHGEAYRGHIFWDEVFCLPFYNLHFPETAKSVLLYRYRRLDKAREYAAANGYRGAMFPWQSGSDGSETTQRYHLNPLSNSWDEDHSHLQRHVSIAVAYNIWNYYWTTRDLEFLICYGAEMFFEIARFWVSMTKYDLRSGRYEIEKVMGPDEFHEKYPGAAETGLKNNSYTNIMVAWLLNKAMEIYDLLPPADRQIVSRKIGLENHELSQWKDISAKLKLEISGEGIIAQFDGFFDLAELDWEKYRSSHSDTARMDRILKAKEDSPDRYQVLKQADTLMVFYLLTKEEWQAILSGLGYSYDERLMKKNFDYYYQRTSHGSTLSYIVHAAVAHEIGYTELGWQLYRQSLFSDYRDIQGGTTGEGIHTGVMAGTIMQAIKGYAGIDFSNDYLRVSPHLPHAWKALRFGITFRKVRYRFHVTGAVISVTAENKGSGPVEIELAGQRYQLPSGKTQTISMSKL
jgi:beta-phosphoglucomutase family hydrolase